MMSLYCKSVKIGFHVMDAFLKYLIGHAHVSKRYAPYYVS